MLPKFKSAPTAVNTRELTEFARLAVCTMADRSLLRKKHNLSYLMLKGGEGLASPPFCRMYGGDALVS